MNAVIGEILPLALGVAISPLPVIAAILMLGGQVPSPAAGRLAAATAVCAAALPAAG